MTVSYGTVHLRLTRSRGRASEHRCIGCGAQAKEWAYQHNGDPELIENGFPYSENPDCYQPMCKHCHKFLDNLHNPEYLEWLQTTGSAIARASLDSEKMKGVGKRLAAYTAQRRKEDPEFAEKLRRTSSANIRVALANPGSPEKVSADRANAARVANRIQRRCLDCGRTAHPAAIGAHQKGSGHSGYQDL